MPRIIGICGMDPTSAYEANESGPDVELWALNEAYVFLKRPAARWFQIHKRGPDGTFDVQNPKHTEMHEKFLKECTCPVYMIEKDPLVPTSVRYPMEEMLNEFGHYFTSTMAYMLALAIHEGCDELRIFGISLDRGIEYVEQKAGMEYFLGIARGRGIRIVLPTQSPLLHAPLYGRDDAWDDHDNLQLRYAGLRLKHAKLEAQMNDTKIRIEEVETLLIMRGSKARMIAHMDSERQSENGKQETPALAEIGK